MLQAYNDYLTGDGQAINVVLYPAAGGNEAELSTVSL